MRTLMSEEFVTFCLGALALLVVGWLWVKDRDVGRLWVKDGSGLWHRAREASIDMGEPQTRTAWTVCGWCLPVLRIVVARTGDVDLASLTGEDRPKTCDRCA